MTFNKVALVTALTMTAALGACANFTPASQAPRTYVAAHDTIDGDCRNERAPVTHRKDGKWTVEDTLPQYGHFVRCRNEQTTRPTEKVAE